MVTPSSIPSSTTSMPDVDDSVIKTGIFDFESASSEEEVDVATIGMGSLPLFFLFFFFFFGLCTLFLTMNTFTCHAGTKVCEKQKVAGNLAKPTPVGPSKLLFHFFSMLSNFVSPYS